MHASISGVAVGVGVGVGAAGVVLSSIISISGLSVLLLFTGSLCCNAAISIYAYLIAFTMSVLVARSNVSTYLRRFL
jgi:hypothetical protein